jgi:succinate dehydrogenase / fumarate reductase, membrane anchor subunit
MAENRVATSKVAGTWAWAFQRLSAVLLIIFLAMHLYASHFMDVSEETSGESLITFDEVSIRLDQLLYIVVDYGMLSMVLLHGLNGLRTVLFDFDMFVKRRKLIDVGLWVVGVATLIWGIVILFPFITNGG